MINKCIVKIEFSLKNVIRESSAIKYAFTNASLDLSLLTKMAGIFAKRIWQPYEAPTMVGLKIFQTMSVRFVSVVYSPMLSIGKLTYFK